MEDENGEKTKSKSSEPVAKKKRGKSAKNIQ